ncbi:hypothetical protein I7I48_01043 [Histoplasma ohiense]|nr:hypothetical protein I7I48_01043 [Histoplasma ohiense (nom. inval.)]
MWSGDVCTGHPWMSRNSAGGKNNSKSIKRTGQLRGNFNVCFRLLSRPNDRISNINPPHASSWLALAGGADYGQHELVTLDSQWVCLIREPAHWPIKPIRP